MFHTERLHVEAFDETLARHALEDRPAFSKALNASVHDDWPLEDMRGLLGFLVCELAKTPGSHQYGGAIILEDPGIVIGDVGFHQLGDDIVLREGAAEIGYSIVPEYRERGIATEAVNGMCDWGFQRLGLKRIYARCDKGNLASQRVLKKAGFSEVPSDLTHLLMFERAVSAVGSRG